MSLSAIFDTIALFSHSDRITSVEITLSKNFTAPDATAVSGVKAIKWMPYHSPYPWLSTYLQDNSQQQLRNCS